jgi:NTE family protein
MLQPKHSLISQELKQLQANGTLSVLSDSQLAARLQNINIPAKADAVFEGGGVKGIALAGSIAVAEQLGVQWQNVAGTSAGAITACLLATGYTGQELIPILTEEMQFDKFMDEDLLDKIPLLGKIASAIFEKGIYEGDYFEDWMTHKLKAKGVDTFAAFMNDDGESRLKLIASDVTRREMIVLPDDLPQYGINPSDFSVARAARMSMSIPYFFEPVELSAVAPYSDGRKRDRRKCFIVDGGLLSNFPVWLFDAKEGETPQWPTYGFKLIEPDSDKPSPSKWPHQYIMSLVSTMLDAHDKAYIDQANFERTIGIPTMGIQTTQFDLTQQHKNLLLRAGQEAAIRFFEQWNFDAHNREYRGLGGNA